MNKVDVETRILLDKIYNLKSEDSILLVKMEEDRIKAEEIKKSSSEKKSDLILKIDKLNDDEVLLVKEGKLLKQAIKTMEKSEFIKVFEMLEIDFDPANLGGQVEFGMPLTLAELKDEITSANDELEAVVKKMNDAITKIDELAIRRESALTDQIKLNEFVELSLAGNSNITRDSLASLLDRFELSIDEQKECAKILMFPEDGLYEYNKKNQRKAGISITEVLVDAKNSKKNETLKEIKNENDIKKEEKVIKSEIFEPVIKLDDSKMNFTEELFKDVELNDDKIEIDNSDIFSNIEVDEYEDLPALETNDFVVFDDNSEVINSIEIKEDTFEPIVLNTKTEEIVMPEPQIAEPVKFEPITIPDFSSVSNEIVNDKKNVDIEKILSENGILVHKLSDKDLSFVKENFNLSVFENNIKIVEELGLNKDLFMENIELIVDAELEKKLSVLIGIGKVPFDIYLNPNILVKYNISELENSIEQLKGSGLDPKKVPLMAF